MIITKPNNASNCTCHCNGTLFTIISGSFRKHLSQIMRLKQLLSKQQVIVLSPHGQAAVNPGDEFIVLDSDPVTHPKLLQDSVFAKIRRSTFLVVANIDGYLGRATILEMGYAIALGITIYTLEPVDDPNLIPYCRLLNEVFPDIHLNKHIPFEDVEDSRSDRLVNLVEHSDLYSANSNYQLNEKVGKLQFEGI